MGPKISGITASRSGDHVVFLRDVHGNAHGRHLVRHALAERLFRGDSLIRRIYKTLSSEIVDVGGNRAGRGTAGKAALEGHFGSMRVRLLLVEDNIVNRLLHPVIK